MSRIRTVDVAGPGCRYGVGHALTAGDGTGGRAAVGTEAGATGRWVGRTSSGRASRSAATAADAGRSLRSLASNSMIRLEKGAGTSTRLTLTRVGWRSSRFRITVMAV